ncbi:MAG TPA: cyclophilin-like fold protein [Chitinophagaceae bacterium]|nr:cyclophilin-like fold protein [Chitinophagaceae bacterium]
MKPLFTFLACLICIQLLACDKNNEVIRSSNTDSTKLKITVGPKTFTATVYDNETVAAFKTRLPLTITMKELNYNEKYFDLPYHLPANASNPGTIQAGDLMLYGSNTLVLFYKTISTSYNYSRIGGINNPLGLATALGSGSKTVRFELEQQRSSINN